MDERTEQRFWSKVNKTETCWLWTGAKTQAGYGSVRIKARTFYAHRVAFEWLVGAIPLGLQLDHLCRQPACVNPAHLEPVTNRENTVRGLAPQVNGAKQLAKTHCLKGHPYDAANTYVAPVGKRGCRTCQRRRQSEYVQRKREGVAT